MNLVPEFNESRRPPGHGHDHDQDHPLTESHALITDAPYSPSTGFATGGRKLASERSEALITQRPVQDTGDQEEGVLTAGHSLSGVDEIGQGWGNNLLMRSQGPVPDCAKQATQGGDSRWALSQAGPAPESSRNLTRLCAQTHPSQRNGWPKGSGG